MEPTLVTAYRDGVEYGLKQALNLVEGIRRRAWDRAADTGERHHEEVADYIQLFFEELRAKLVLKQEKASMSTIFEGELGPVESKGYREVYTTVGSWESFCEMADEGRTVGLDILSFPDCYSDKKLIVFTENEFNDYLKMVEDRIDASYREGFNCQDGIGRYEHE